MRFDHVRKKAPLSLVLRGRKDVSMPEHTVRHRLRTVILVNLSIHILVLPQLDPHLEQGFLLVIIDKGGCGVGSMMHAVRLRTALGRSSHRPSRVLCLLP